MKFSGKRDPEPAWLEWLAGCAEDEYSSKRIAPAAHNLGMLTGQDTRVLAAIDACWQLYASSDEDGSTAALNAIVQLLPGMQVKCWVFARELIARALDWGDRDRLWPRIETLAGHVMMERGL